MDLKSLIAKMDQIEQGLLEAEAPAAAPAAAAPAAGPAAGSRAQFDQFKADDAKMAAIAKVKTLTTPQGGANFIDPKDGIIKYQDQSMAGMGGQGQIKEFPFDWFQKGQEKEFFATLQAAGLEVIPVERKQLFGTSQVAGVKGGPEAIANLEQAAKQQIAQRDADAQGVAQAMEQLKKLTALIVQYGELKAKKAAAGGAKGAATGAGASTTPVAKPVAKEGIEFKSSIAKDLVESFGYTSAEQLDEYSMSQFGQDAGDFSRGAWNGLTLGTGDNITAGVKSAFGSGSYKDELAKQTAASQEAEKRSPWLYNTGNIAGSIAAPIPGGAAVAGMKGLGTLGKIAAQGALNYGATKAVDVVKSKHDLKTLGGGKGDANIAALQKVVGVLPDGLMGPKTKAAVAAWQKQNGLPATGAADPATLKAAGISEGTTMNKQASVAEQIRSLQARLEMLESKKEDDREGDEEGIEETYQFTDEELNEEIFVDEAGNYYKSNGEQITDEGWMDAIGRGLNKGFQTGVKASKNATVANKIGNAVGRVGKAGAGAAKAVGNTIAKNPGKSVAAAAGLGALAANMTGGAGGSDTPVKPPAPGPKPPTAPTAPAADGSDKEMDAMKAQIEQLLSDLAQNPNPEIQKGVAAARAQWGKVTGDANIGSADKPAAPQASNATANTTGGPTNMGTAGTSADQSTLKVYK